MSNDTYFTVSPIYYRGGNYETGVRVSNAEKKVLRAELKKGLAARCDTAFKTKQDAVDAIAESGLNADDYIVCETTNW